MKSIRNTIGIQKSPNRNTELKFFNHFTPFLVILKKHKNYEFMINYWIRVNVQRDREIYRDVLASPVHMIGIDRRRS